MSKLGIFCDVHVRPVSWRSIPGEPNWWVEHTIQVMGRAFDEFARLGVKRVVVAGDLFDLGSRIDTVTFNAVLEFFNSKESRFDVNVLAGNHDQAVRGQPESILRALSPRCTVFETPYSMCLDKDTRLIFVPYTEYPDQVRAVIEKAETDCPSSKKLLIGHLALEGATVGPQEFSPKAPMNVSVLDGVDLALLGHYHKPQYLNSRVSYIGSLLAKNWGEANQFYKGAVVVDTDETPWKVLCINIPGIRYQIVSLDEAFKAEPGCFKNMFVRVEYTGGLDESKILTDLVRRGDAITFELRRIDPQETALRVQVAGVGGPSQADYVHRYAEDNAEPVDVERLIAVANDVMKGVPKDV